MSTQSALSKNHPFMVAWEKYASTPEYANSLKWALAETYDDGRLIAPENRKTHAEGAIWLAFTKGLELAASPAPESEDEECSHFDEVTPIETADRSQKKGEKFRIVNVNKNCYKLYLFGHFIGACSSEDAVRSREKSIADGINRYIHKAVKERLKEAVSPAQPEKRDES